MNCTCRVTHSSRQFPVAQATVALLDANTNNNPVATARTGADGIWIFKDVPAGTYKVQCKVFGQTQQSDVAVVPGKDSEVTLDCDLGFELTLWMECDCKPQQVMTGVEGRALIIRADSKSDANTDRVDWTFSPEVASAKVSAREVKIAPPLGLKSLAVGVVVMEKNDSGAPATISISKDVTFLQADTQKIDGNVRINGRVALQEPVGVRLHRTASDPTLDQALWVAIRNRTRAMSFARYQEFMDRALRWEERSYEVPKNIQDTVSRERIQRDLNELGAHLHGVQAYKTLKLLTETFLLLECGVRIEPGEGHRTPFDFGEEAYRLGAPFTIEDMEERLKAYLGDRAQLPYITRVVKAAFPEVERDAWSGRLIAAKINEPCLIELIWSYWMEEGMLVQTMNAVSQRFQNVRAGGDRDPLLNLEIDPLRPLNNILWGYVQDEFNRLTVRRRAYEYVHHYGLTLYGKATAGMRTADSRSKFLEAFHNLLYQSSIFFKEDFQTTVIADGFPLLNSLKEVHLILAQGAQNQFGDLPWTARVEMMLTQYMLARREIRDFLQSRAMVPYKEPWEAQVDSMKTLQGWTDVTVSHFRDLAVYGEQLLLSIRYGDWIAVNDEDSAKNWARYFRPEIQGYLHAYRAATGIDLTNADTVDATIPGIHLQKRMANQRTR
jgi:hypothetical protein